jgi:uncharacterized protein involved in response to NO
MAIPRTQPYRGPDLFCYGLRPFFLAGSLQAALAMLIWIMLLTGVITLPTAFTPRDWHIHAMLHGYLGAVIAGYLLTAMPNWTGKLPLTGWPLAALVALWLAGRIATTFSGPTGWQIAAAIDLSFPLVLMLVISREVLAGRNWRNLKIIALLGFLLLGNAVFHYEAGALGRAEYGMRIGIAAIAMLVIVIGGRLVPSFTRNHLTRAGIAALPRRFGPIDIAAIIAAASALAVWILDPQALAAAVLLGVAGALHLMRVAGWRGYRIRGEAFSLAMNLAYACIPVGFLMMSHAIITGREVNAGLHVLAGGFALMTIAVMARLSLAHTRREIVASPLLRAVLVVIALSILARVGAIMDPARMIGWLILAGGFWVAGFGAFALSFSRIWCGPAQERKERAVRKVPDVRDETVAVAPPREQPVIEPQQLQAFLTAFYKRARTDPLIGPIFTQAIPDARWEEHVARIHAFWMRVLTGKPGYSGNPFRAHQTLALEPGHFARWLALFTETAEHYFDQAARTLLVERAHRIGQSLQLGLGLQSLRAHHDA